ncbi:C-C motif chemokine 3-like isoform X2 [Erythrolamprus reginae]|uniref:C-C motif chemokine 3-like isoform X2 n=1 Tax=Erythrolamprus reginae TaxID=121349 RepID=UPI00396CCD4B
MKTLLAFLLLGVSLSLAAQSPRPAAAPGQVELRDWNVDPAPTVCCLDFTTRPIPLHLLRSFVRTNGRCTKPAIIFTTVRDVKICADPSQQWVQDRIRDLSPTGAPGSAP